MKRSTSDNSLNEYMAIMREIKTASVDTQIKSLETFVARYAQCNSPYNHALLIGAQTELDELKDRLETEKNSSTKVVHLQDFKLDPERKAISFRTMQRVNSHSSMTPSPNLWRSSTPFQAVEPPIAEKDDRTPMSHTKG